MGTLAEKPRNLGTLTGFFAEKNMVSVPMFMLVENLGTLTGFFEGETRLAPLYLAEGGGD
jgi:hypothetical protein